MLAQTLKEILHKRNIKDFDLSVSPPKPAGNYVAVKRVGNLAFISGQMPIYSSGKVITPVQETNVATGYQAAELAMANALKQLIYCEEIIEIRSIIRIDGYFDVNNGNDIPKMLDGASNLVFQIFGKEDGKHARTVFSTNQLPYQALTELVVIAEVE